MFCYFLTYRTCVFTDLVDSFKVVVLGCVIAVVAVETREYFIVGTVSFVDLDMINILVLFIWVGDVVNV